MAPIFDLWGFPESGFGSLRGPAVAFVAALAPMGAI